MYFSFIRAVLLEFVTDEHYNHSDQENDPRMGRVKEEMRSSGPGKEGDPKERTEKSEEGDVASRFSDFGTIFSTDQYGEKSKQMAVGTATANAG
ncbi:hypothetical protein P0Y35_08470 [Kiritimatiellaeota bacterium B1221]|nr:hypothetical protein [Kiritimatiellaeota bacterium B1221]